MWYNEFETEVNRLTIKRRLFISNILMIIIPILLSLTVALGVGLIILGATNFDDGRSLKDDNSYFKAIQDMDTFGEQWAKGGDPSQMTADVDAFNARHGTGSASLAVFCDMEQVYPLDSVGGGEVLNYALSKKGTLQFIMDNTGVYRKEAGEYTIVYVDNDFYRYDLGAFSNNRNSYINYGSLSFLFVVAIILLTNRFLTRFVFKSIIIPLDTLVYGVHQIRDGNLEYRIAYTGRDEFAGICADFNEMAQRLLDSVNARQKDEANRRELIAGISHDLRTPLTSIKAYVEGIEKGVASTPELNKRYIDTIKRRTEDLEHIVNQLFLFSKLDIGEFPMRLEPVDMGKELDRLIASVTEEYEKKGLFVTIAENERDVPVQIDRVQFRSAVINILENSVKYKDKESCDIQITCRASDQAVTIALSDNGPGVPREAQEKLFDVFYRTDPSRTNSSKGSGLGLAITAKIMERLGGSIRAENAVNGGLAIIMTFPKYTGGDQN